MKKHEQLQKEYDKVKGEARMHLSNLISQNLGKELDIEMEFCLTFMDSMTGEDIDFSWEGISEEGDLLCVNYNTGEDIEGIKIDMVHTWAVITMIEMLEVHYA